ncbi:MAG TPA: hypothetical protein VHW66_17890 [Stellaceae bacterium]|jgi:hypothetical protein|nr:hypothetical protein [Stellaceae bacterium]
MSSHLAWLVPTASLLAALFVAYANYAVQRWRHRADRLGATVEELCTETNDAADLATKYWLTERPQPVPTDVQRLEAQLVGRQHRLQQLSDALKVQDPQFDLNSAETLSADLYDAMTGGNFRVQLRALDLDRAQLVQARAAELNGELRRAFARRYWRW